MKISIIIPAYNEAKYIGPCLESIFRNKHSLLHEIIVVDNGSSDETASIASGFKEVEVVKESVKGVNRARVKGLIKSSGDIIAYLDADTIMPAGWLEKVYQEFSSDDKLVALSGPYLYYDASSLYNLVVRLYWFCLAFPSYFLVKYMAVGGNFAVRRKSLEQIGGFDRNIKFYGDDTDIARRLHKIGKVKFNLSFIMYSSARRLKNQGILTAGLLYASNFLSVVILKRPLTKAYKDIR